MEYMPEYYTLENKLPKVKNKPKPQMNTKKFTLFYILKGETTDLDTNIQQILSKTSSRNINTVKSKEIEKIQSELSQLITNNSSMFISFNITEQFSCMNKESGLHRDPIDCSKYYYCSDMKMVKTLKCPQRSTFDMNGCFCNLNPNGDCSILDKTFCHQRPNSNF